MFAQNKDILLSYIFQMFPFSKSFPKTKEARPPFLDRPRDGLAYVRSIAENHPFDAIFGLMPHAVIRHKVQSVRFFVSQNRFFLLSCRDTVALIAKMTFSVPLHCQLQCFVSIIPCPK